MTTLLEDLPQQEYDFKSWNCYTLAQWIRNYYGLTPLPDFNWAVNQFDNEDDKPARISEILEHNLEKYATRNLDVIKEYDLVLLNIYNKYILGTFVDKHVCVMSLAGATCVPISRIGTYIDSIWTYDN